MLKNPINNMAWSNDPVQFYSRGGTYSMQAAIG